MTLKAWGLYRKVITNARFCLSWWQGRVIGWLLYKEARGYTIADTVGNRMVAVGWLIAVWIGNQTGAGARIAGWLAICKWRCREQLLIAIGKPDAETTTGIARVVCQGANVTTLTSYNKQPPIYRVSFSSGFSGVSNNTLYDSLQLYHHLQTSFVLLPVSFLSIEQHENANDGPHLTATKDHQYSVTKKNTTRRRK